MDQKKLRGIDNIQPFREDDKLTMLAVVNCFQQLYEMAINAQTVTQRDELADSIRHFSNQLQYWMAWNHQDMLRTKKKYEDKMAINITPLVVPRFSGGNATNMWKLMQGYVHNARWQDSFQSIIDDAYLIMDVNNERSRRPQLEDNQTIAHRIAMVAEHLRNSLKEKMSHGTKDKPRKRKNS